MGAMSENEVLGQEPQFAALVGIDWADQKHAWCLQAAGTTQRESGEVEHTPEAVEAWVGQLCQRFGNRPIAVAVEQVKGALVFMLSKYEPLHLFPVPPAMSAKLRAALYPSGAKDDPRDADLLVDLLWQHRDKLRRLSPDSEATRRVQNLVEERRHLVEEKTAQSNRLTNHLKIYFPQMLEWFDRLDTELVCALLEQWPTLEELQKVPPARLRTFFRKQRCHYPELVERRLVGIRQAMPAIRDRAVIEAKSAAVKSERATDPKSHPGSCGSGPQDRGGGGSASGIFLFLSRCRERGRCWRHACWRHLDRSESVTPTPRKYKPTVGSRP